KDAVQNGNFAVFVNRLHDSRTGDGIISMKGVTIPLGQMHTVNGGSLYGVGENNNVLVGTAQFKSDGGVIYIDPTGNVNITGGNIVAIAPPLAPTTKGCEPNCGGPVCC